MPSVKLTKSFIKSIEIPANRITYYDTEVPGLTLRVSPSGTKTYSIIYRNNNRAQKRYTIGKDSIISLPEAKLEAKKLLAQAAQGTDIQKEKSLIKNEPLNSTGLTLIEYLNNFYIDWSTKNHKDETITKNRLLKTLRPLHNTLLIDIDHPTLNKVLYQYAVTNKVSNATLNRTIAAIQGALSRAVEFGYIKQNKLSGFKRYKETENNIRYLTHIETKRFFKTIDQIEGVTKNIILTAYYTGMRRGEIFSLEWVDIDFTTNQIILNQNNTKSGKSRNIPIHKSLKLILNKLYKEHTNKLVFPSPVTGGRIDNIYKSWRNFLRSAKIENFRFHDLRHNFASQLIMKGESLSLVRELLGHSDFKMTLRYAHLAPEHKQKAVDLL